MKGPAWTTGLPQPASAPRSTMTPAFRFIRSPPREGFFPSAPRIVDSPTMKRETHVKEETDRWTKCVRPGRLSPPLPAAGLAWPAPPQGEQVHLSPVVD